ncbi:MAG: TonB-dependent receptor plug domain-containing protein [Opitutae bacterium]|nr:TonB-dependent receptor plug domain-containing protein [Opitutae bacterium]
MIPRTIPGRVSARAIPRLSLTAFALSLASSGLWAQEAAPAEKKAEDITVLSPFVVSSKQVQGYVATTTLAGNGLRTELSDVGSAVSVVTAKFLEDTGSTNLRDVLVYTTGTEVTGLGGNFSGAGFGTEQFREAGLSNRTGTRVRGLAEATQARNFFRSIIPTDSYNTDRIDINRGANALLFGVGSPAGIINYSTTEALIGETSGKVDLRAGSFGSYRVSANYNQTLADDQFAVRVAALQDDEKFKQEPAFNEDRRLFAAIGFSPKALKRGAFSGTTLRANFETGEIDANNPRTLPPQDRISSWFEPYAEWVAAGIPAKPTWNAHQPLGATPRGLGVAQNINRGPTIIFPDHTSADPRDPVGTVNGTPVAGRPFVSTRYYFPGVGLVGTAAHLAPTRLGAGLLSAGYPDAEFYAQPTIADPSIFDFYNQLLDGPNKEEKSKFEAASISLEQLMFRKKLGLQFAYDDQSYQETLMAMIPDDAQYISIDINTVMWDGTPNPNFGRPYVGTAGSAGYSKEDITTYRARVFYDFDFAEHDSRAPWLRWLGRHVVSGLYQKETYDRDTRSGAPYTVLDNWPNGNNQNRAADVGKLVGTLNYLGPSLASASTTRGAGIPRIMANRLDFPATIANYLLLTRSVAPSNATAPQAQYAVRYDNFDVIRADEELTETASGALKARRVLESRAFSLQSFLLDSHIVGTIGWRNERSEIKRVSAPVNPVESNRLVNSPLYSIDAPGAAVQRFESTPRAWSVVAKTPAKWVRRVPGLSSFNVFYGESQNFDPPESTVLNVFGDEIAPASGQTTDFGFMLSAWSDRVTLRTTWYETNQINVRNSSLSTAIGGIMNRHTKAFDAVTNGYEPDSNGDHFPDGYVAPPQVFLDQWKIVTSGNTITVSNPGHIDTSDYVTKGVELELAVKPYAGWSVLLNVTKQEASRSNSGAALRELLFNTPTSTGRTLAEEWSNDNARSIALNAGITTPTQGGTLANEFLRYILNPLNSVLLADGGPAQELRKWRANAVLAYDFTHGALRGVGAGVGARWQDKVAIGYPVVTYEADGLPSDGVDEDTDFRGYDVRNPFLGDDELNWDFWVSYSRPILKERIHWKVQLNVRNAFAGDHLIPIAANPNGQVAVSRIGAPMEWTISSTFAF